jgi:hypothetical protein
VLLRQNEGGAGFPLDVERVESLLQALLRLEKMGRDPILIAYALAASDRIVVTKEVSAPSKQGANRKIPDVCNSLGVQPMKDFDFFRALGFTTRWPITIQVKFTATRSRSLPTKSVTRHAAQTLNLAHPST